MAIPYHIVVQLMQSLLDAKDAFQDNITFPPPRLEHQSMQRLSGYRTYEFASEP